jgi:hypothetical protein
MPPLAALDRPPSVEDEVVEVETLVAVAAAAAVDEWAAAYEKVATELPQMSVRNE